jgi:hypothetical protein
MRGFWVRGRKRLVGIVLRFATKVEIALTGANRLFCTGLVLKLSCFKAPIAEFGVHNSGGFAQNVKQTADRVFNCPKFSTGILDSCLDCLVALSRRSRVVGRWALVIGNWSFVRAERGLVRERDGRTWPIVIADLYGRTVSQRVAIFNRFFGR